jgi:hypothetical protein
MGDFPRIRSVYFKRVQTIIADFGNGRGATLVGGVNKIVVGRQFYGEA